MALLSQFERVVQAIYSYRCSNYYSIHLALIFLLGIYIIHLFLREWTYRHKAYSYSNSKAHSVLSEREWERQVSQQTAKQVLKLRESAAYRDYLEDKNRPNSHYNRHIEVEEIVFSDEEDEIQAYQRLIYGQKKKQKAG